jgi:subtilisin family serine protease
MYGQWGMGWRWVVVMGLFLLAMGCATPRPPDSGSNGAVARVPKQLLAHQIIVTLAPATPEHWTQMAQALAQTYDLPQVGAFPLNSLGIQCIVYQIPANRPVADILQRLATDPRVESVQPNYVFEGLGVLYNDPYAPLQHGARSIHADRAHQTATGKGIRIAVIDTGVDTEHPDLQGRVVKTANFVEGGEHTFTQDAHGTAVAGVIAARANNAIGIFGIAPDASLVAVKACWQRAPAGPAAVCSSWTLAKAIDFVILEQVQVLNMSLAGPPDPLLTRLLTNAIRQGVSVVAAVLEAGNDAPGFPAMLETVIAVRAGETGASAPRSEAERQVQPVAAPGMDVLTTVPGQTYDFFSGSSLATAHVSGVVALLLERDSRLTPAQIHTLLRAPGRPLQVASETPYAAIPLVNACVALNQLLGQPVCQ